MKKPATTLNSATVLLTLFTCLLAIVLFGQNMITVQSAGSASLAPNKPTPTPTPSVTSTIFDKTLDDTTFLQLRSDDLNPDLSPSGGHLVSTRLRLPPASAVLLMARTGTCT